MSMAINKVIVIGNRSPTSSSQLASTMPGKHPTLTGARAKVPSEKSKRRESRQIPEHRLQRAFLCGTLSLENAVHARISPR
jgi:hypothetical protein